MVAIFLDKFRQIPELTDVASDQENAGPRLSLLVNRDTAASFGILPSTVDNTLGDAFGQRIVSTIYSPLNQYHVILEVDPRFQSGPEALNNIYLNSSAGQEVPLSTLVNSTLTAAPIVINHQGMFPATTLSFNLKPGVALGDAVSAIRKFEKESGKPNSLVTTFQGTANAFLSSLAGEPLLIAAALVTIYIILGVLYESTIHPITILSTLPSAGIGALLILMAVNLDFSVIAMIGIILLIGIVKKNGIMLVDFALDAERKQGLTPEESIYEACRLRFRPILMTTMAALLGGVPLMLGVGAGSEIRQPLGYTIVGGLALSQLLTLYTTPVVYLYLDRLSQFLGQRPTVPQNAGSSMSSERVALSGMVETRSSRFRACTNPPRGAFRSTSRSIVGSWHGPSFSIYRGIFQWPSSIGCEQRHISGGIANRPRLSVSTPYVSTCSTSGPSDLQC